MCCEIGVIILKQTTPAAKQDLTPTIIKETSNSTVNFIFQWRALVHSFAPKCTNQNQKLPTICRGCHSQWPHFPICKMLTDSVEQRNSHGISDENSDECRLQKLTCTAAFAVPDILCVKGLVALTCITVTKPIPKPITPVTVMQNQKKGDTNRSIFSTRT